ncbi:MAG TPA: type II toxin-antitoxin system VapC family toxin [Mycobacteriales bacterium]|nr:type II toxin-antitoxin system VapC family toxin [Mycobacteriales bacterium]
MRPLLLDVNVVLAAQRGDHPQHGQVRPWFDQIMAGGSDFGVPSTVWASFLRLTTSRRIFSVPTPLAEAFTFLERTRARPQHLTLEPGPRHLVLLRGLCEDTEAAGDLVPDAVLGAIALEHGCVVATLDRDFARFTTVRHLRPDSGG